MGIYGTENKILAECSKKNVYLNFANTIKVFAANPNVNASFGWHVEFEWFKGCNGPDDDEYDSFIGKACSQEHKVTYDSKTGRWKFQRDYRYPGGGGLKVEEYGQGTWIFFDALQYQVNAETYKNGSSSRFNGSVYSCCGASNINRTQNNISYYDIAPFLYALIGNNKLERLNLNLGNIELCEELEYIIKELIFKVKNFNLTYLNLGADFKMYRYDYLCELVNRNNELINKNNQLVGKIQNLEFKIQDLHEVHNQAEEKYSDLEASIKSEQDVLDNLLLRSSEQGNLMKVEAACQLGAVIGAQDLLGRTPLFLALQNDHFKVAKYFIDREASLFVRNKDNDSILDLKCCENNLPAVEFIIKNFPTVGAVNELLVTALQNCNTQEMKTFIANELLFQAVAEDNIELMNLAFDNGASANAVSTDEALQRVLHVACLCDSENAVKLLIEKGASPEAENFNGLRPDALTNNPVIKEIIQNIRDQSAVVIQRMIRGITTRNNCTKLRDKWRKNLRNKFSELSADLVKEEKFDSINEITSAFRSNTLFKLETMLNNIKTDNDKVVENTDGSSAKELITRPFV